MYTIPCVSFHSKNTHKRGTRYYFKSLYYLFIYPWIYSSSQKLKKSATTKEAQIILKCVHQCHSTIPVISLVSIISFFLHVTCLGPAGPAMGPMTMLMPTILFF